MEETPANESLGEFLRSERERRGLSIEQVASATKISQRVLYALESDHYSDLPALPFVRGFVKNYAKFIGLDGNQVLARFKPFLENHSKERPNKDAGHSGYAFERPEGEQAKKVLWATMTGMMMLGTLVVFVFKPSLKRRHSEHIERIQSPDKSAAPEPPVVGAASPLASGLPGASPAASTVAVALPVAPTTPATPASTGVAKFTPPKTPLVLAPPATPAPATPKPTAVAAASVAPSTPPVATAAPATPMPTVKTAEATPVPSANPAEKPDELQSGLDYDPKEVKYKVIVRALADVIVRYQCDDKKIMKFTLKADKILVLRGKGAVRFQVSNPDSVTVNANGAIYRPMSKAPGQLSLNSTASWVWPSQPVEKIDEKFKLAPGLPKTAAPDFNSQSTESAEG